jgi:hypothetical protein
MWLLARQTLARRAAGFELVAVGLMVLIMVGL